LEERVAARLGAITLLTDGGFPSAELLGWFKGRSSWRSVMRLRADTWIQGTAAPMGCQVRRLRLPRGHCRGFRDVLLWAEGTQRVNLVRAYGLRDPQRIDRLLLVVAIAVLLGSLQGCAVSLAGERRRIDPHGSGGMSFGRISLKWLQQCVANHSKSLMAWATIPLRILEPCIPSRGVLQRQKGPWFTRIDLPPQQRQNQLLAVP